MMKLGLNKKLVVSPLVALMQEQVSQLQKLSISNVYLTETRWLLFSQVAAKGTFTLALQDFRFINTLD